MRRCRPLSCSRRFSPSSSFSWSTSAIFSSIHGSRPDDRRERHGMSIALRADDAGAAFRSLRRGIDDFLAFARRRPSVLFGLVIVCVTLFLAFFGAAVAPYDPERALPGEGLHPPS